MTKFTKIKGTEIRKAYECNENGEKIRAVAILGKVKELLDKNIISPTENTNSTDFDKWIVVTVSGETSDLMNTLEQAKGFAMDLVD